MSGEDESWSEHHGTNTSSDTLTKTVRDNWIREAANRNNWKRYQQIFIHSENAIDSIKRQISQ
ncbi:unnamed protein product [Toxocara canis]|uniref:Craniofacial development protein 2 n=1 Tax=Toxocara canis TaxID=6265 RepID=A0A183U692_TOXCA|nr:unnamed protein product [Toxocara canis]